MRQTLINVDKRPEWLDGVATINREMTSERIGMRHNCVFHGLKLINTAVCRDVHADRALYSEKVEIPEMQALNGSSTRLKFNVNWMDSKLPPEKQEGHAGRTGRELRAPQEGLREQSGVGNLSSPSVACRGRSRPAPISFGHGDFDRRADRLH